MAHTWRDRTQGEPLHISLAAGTLTVSFGGRSNLSFDGEGRLVGAWFDGLTYRRALDNRVLLKWVDPAQPGLRNRRFLDDAERRAVLTRAYAAAAQVQAGLATGTVDPGDTDAAFVARVEAHLHEVAGWDWARLEAEHARFHAVYKPISILPPDQYLALVLQATEGCSYNECSFCTFYRDRPFRIAQPAAFSEHIDAVQAFFGRGLTVRRTLFLADANAVIIPQARLEPLLELANARFPILPQALNPAARRAWRAAHPWHLDGIYAFISAPDAQRKTPADFAAMRAQNVARLYVGLETGHDPLRAFLRKQGTAADVRAAVAAIKAGGVRIGLIFMVGIGGRTYQQAHFDDTVALLRTLPLDAGDLIYLSPFVPSDDSPYVADAAAAGIAPLDDDALRAEEQRFRDALLPWAKARGVRVSHYDVREFVY